ncbi:ECF-type sigma factor [Sphingobium lignivorans]|uniref:RNA polymerase sigma factor (TIGR02999 family) n=1 Tax=Sphingobium lignivorans TaxID=2735886 RepID=A0ABR6NHT0_9SPHN|nr:ECF-type sigma factor [Sphingobium lignivorans]MBB5985749.1 RNA polymerase sigma factor (TIGR02999 family) [Sphingobium lignivorans]
MDRSDGGFAHLVERWRSGDRVARDELIGRMLPELRQIAAARLRNELNSSLSTDDLINDAVVRFMRLSAIDLADRAHFIALASRIMRNVLTDHARAKAADKRQHHKIELNTRVDGGQRIDLESLNFALIRLGAIDPALMELVEMRYFGAMSIEDVAIATDQSPATVKRRWRTARAWLADAMAETIDNG